MRVIFTIDYSPWSNYSGGAQRSTHSLAVEMVRRGHTVHVINTKPPWESVEIPKNLPYTHHWAGLPAFRSKRRASLRPLSPIFVANAIYQIIRSDPKIPTVVHSNGEEGGLVHLLRRRFDFGFISTPRHPHYPDAFFEYPFEQMPWHEKSLLWIAHGKYMMQASAARNADYICPPSRWAAETLKKAFNLPDERLAPIYNGVPGEFLSYRRLAEAHEGPIVFFGRYSKTKGIDTLIEAISRLNVGPIPPVYLIGRGTYKHRMRHRVHKHGLDDIITFKPWMSHDELGELLSRSRLAVLPSRSESFGLSVVSAMSVGTPVITTDVNSLPEITDHGRYATTIPPGDSGELARAIDYCLENPKDTFAKADRALEYVRSRFTWERSAQKFETQYQKTLDELHQSANFE